jgi:hypothetical protein
MLRGSNAGETCFSAVNSLPTTDDAPNAANRTKDGKSDFCLQAVKQIALRGVGQLADA